MDVTGGCWVHLEGYLGLFDLVSLYYLKDPGISGYLLPVLYTIGYLPARGKEVLMWYKWSWCGSCWLIVGTNDRLSKASWSDPWSVGYMGSVGAVFLSCLYCVRTPLDKNLMDPP